MVEHFDGLAADVQGDREEAPVVLLHGLTFNRSMWTPITQRVAAADPARRMVAFDLPGHAASDPRADYRVEAVAEVVHRAVTTAGFAPPVVVGHSVSGLIATFYAARYPTRGVVNVDQPLDIRAFAELVRSLEDRLRGDDFAELWGMFAASFHVELLPTDMQQLVQSITHVDRDVVLGYWAQVFELPPAALSSLVDDSLAQIRERSVHYTYVSGSVVAPSHAQWLTERLPGANVVSWPDSSHFPHLAHPDAFADIVTSTAAW